MKYEQLKELYYKLSEEEYENFYFTRYNSENTVRLNMNINGNGAFYVQCPEIYELITQIFEDNIKINSLCVHLPKAAISSFKLDSLIDEIVITNKIEGVRSTRREIGDVVNKLEKKTSKKYRFEGLIAKYNMLPDISVPINSCENLRKLYDEFVLPEVVAENPDNFPDGELFRKDRASVINGAQKLIHTGLYPESKIISEMSKAISFLNDDKINLFIRVAVFHYLFGYIHPFYDGNGRTSRFISSYMLANYINPLIGFRLSYTIEANSAKYDKAFRDCNSEKNKGDITPFIISFLEIVAQATTNLISALDKRDKLLTHYTELLSKYEEMMNNKDLDLAYVLLQGTLFSTEGLTSAELQEILRIKSPQTITARLSHMRDYGLLSVLIDEKDVKHYKLDVDAL